MTGLLNQEIIKHGESLVSEAIEGASILLHNLLISQDHKVAPQPTVPTDMYRLRSRLVLNPLPCSFGNDDEFNIYDPQVVTSRKTLGNLILNNGNPVVLPVVSKSSNLITDLSAKIFFAALDGNFNTAYMSSQLVYLTGRLGAESVQAGFLPTTFETNQLKPFQL
jgi:hypothetical protein